MNTLHNYQLYRTNYRLSGQLKWNLYIESGNDKSGNNRLFINDFKLSPISDNIYYNPSVNDGLFNYSHMENIKKFYKSVESSFYKPYISNTVSSCEPLMVSEDYYDKKSNAVELRNSVFDMGMKRSKYTITGKPIEIFCPVWLESYSKDSPLAFKFSIRVKSKRDKTELREVISKILVIDKYTVSNVHDKFVDYIYNYINSISVGGEIGSGLININFKNISACITGVNVKSGTVESNKTLFHLTDNILSQERLLMDTDDMIMSCFEDNNLISKQLFNFNFLLDPEELIVPALYKEMIGQDITISVHAGILTDGVFTPFEKKDFYTNYEYIECQRAGTRVDSDLDINILETIQDYKNIALQDKNKINQSIIHWSLEGNNEYIFNTYTGFGGYKQETDGYSRLTHLYQNSPDIWSKVYSCDTQSTLDWCYSKDINTLTELTEFKNTVLNNPGGILPKIGGLWGGLLRYKKEASDQRYCCILCMPEVSINKFKYVIGDFTEIRVGDIIKDRQEVTGLDGVLMGTYNDINIFLIRTEDSWKSKLTFYNIRKTLNHIRYSTSDDIKDSIRSTLGWLCGGDMWQWQEWFDSVKEPSIISMTTLGYKRVTRPSIKCTEVEHYNTTNTEVIFRYDGNITPTFVSPDKNNMYFKKTITPSESYINYPGYKKLYPSIGYYPWKKIDLSLLTDEDISIPDEVSNQYYEYPWFNLGKFLLLKPVMSISFELDDKSTDNVENQILNTIKDIYNVDDDKSYYIYNKLYNVSINWEYSTESEIHKYIYKVKLTLK